MKFDETFTESLLHIAIVHLLFYFLIRHIFWVSRPQENMDFFTSYNHGGGGGYHLVSSSLTVPLVYFGYQTKEGNAVTNITKITPVLKMSF